MLRRSAGHRCAGCSAPCRGDRSSRCRSASAWRGEDRVRAVADRVDAEIPGRPGLKTMEPIRCAGSVAGNRASAIVSWGPRLCVVAGNLEIGDLESVAGRDPPQGRCCRRARRARGSGWRRRGLRPGRGARRCRRRVGAPRHKCDHREDCEPSSVWDHEALLLSDRPVTFVPPPVAGRSCQRLGAVPATGAWGARRPLPLPRERRARVAHLTRGERPPASAGRGIGRDVGAV